MESVSSWKGIHTCYVLCVVYIRVDTVPGCIPKAGLRYPLDVYCISVGYTS